jgi:hypothetical protein
MLLAARSLSLALIIATSTARAAQAEPPAPPRRGEITEYAFEDDAVLGDTAQPLGEVLRVRQRGPRNSLVQARSSFVPELLESVERL